MAQGEISVDPYRSSRDTVICQKGKLSRSSEMKAMLDSIPLPVFIVNDNRQILIFNRAVKEMLDVEEVDGVLGRRPGEVLNCIHAFETDGGCGTTDSCKFCNVLNSMLDSQAANEMNKREARLVTRNDGKEINYDMMVSSYPLHLEGESFSLVTLMDITSEKRKMTLERVFFHDVMNTAHGLLGTLDLMEMTNNMVDLKKMVQNSHKITHSLIDEISYHKDILYAESGELKVKAMSILSTDVLEDVVRHLLNLREAKGKMMSIESSSEKFTLETDERLLRRVLINLTKNALEASETVDIIKLGCEYKDGEAVFSVWNRAVIPEDVKAQIWQRSFSTKGEGRGLGTYSIKLFTEQYLNGIVDLISSEGDGTTLKVRLRALT